MERAAWSDLGRWFIERLQISSERPDPSLRSRHTGLRQDDPPKSQCDRHLMLEEGSKQLASLNSLILFFRELDPKGMDEQEWNLAMEQLLESWRGLNSKLERLQTIETEAEEFALSSQEFWTEVDDLSGRVAAHSQCFESPFHD